jgi:hypothetical protein
LRFNGSKHFCCPLLNPCKVGGILPRDALFDGTARKNSYITPRKLICQKSFKQQRTRPAISISLSGGSSLGWF